MPAFSARRVRRRSSWPTVARSRSRTYAPATGSTGPSAAAPTALEALRPPKAFLARADVDTDEFVVLAAGTGYKPANAIRTQARARVDRIRELIEWPRAADDNWCKGFLAGIFDAEGSYLRG